MAQKYPHCTGAQFYEDGSATRVTIQRSEDPDDWGHYNVTNTATGLFWYEGDEPMTEEISRVISQVIIDRWADYE